MQIAACSLKEAFFNSELNYTVLHKLFELLEAMAVVNV